MSEPLNSPDGTPPAPPPADELDDAGRAVVTQEVTLLDGTLVALDHARRRVYRSYDHELVDLRDEISEARLEDVAPLLAQMERLQAVAARRAEVPTGNVDLANPYFGHLRLEESGRKRDILIGNATYIDTERAVRIVDWRDAPVSRLYYRYAEGDDYEEEFGGRTTEGKVLARRSVVIARGALRRVLAPQGTFVSRDVAGGLVWRRVGVHASKLAGGQGTAARPALAEEYAVQRGRFGVRIAGREDRHLPDIPALIDPRQFDLISKPGSHVAVIQGGAGSGKTTIGLHRMAYLAFQDPRRFTPDKMIVVVFNDALQSYIVRVLPALGVEGVQVITFADWASRQRKRHVPRLRAEYADVTMSIVSRLKKHPVMLTLIDEHVAREESVARDALGASVSTSAEASRVLAAWDGQVRVPLSRRLSGMTQWLRGERAVGADTGAGLARDTVMRVTRALERLRLRAKDVVWDWAELVTDRERLAEGFDRLAPGAFTRSEISLAVQHSAGLVTALGLDRRDDDDEPKEDERAKSARPVDDGQLEATVELDDETRRHVRKRPPRDEDGGDDDDVDEDRYLAVDGVDEQAAAVREIDREDDALLLRLFQRKRGPLLRDKKTPLYYEHIFVDEAQDFSPVEVATLVDCATPARSITLAGDTSQRLLLDNGFTDWQTLLTQLGLAAVAIEPLRIGYRSTIEVLEFARAVLGPLADPEPPIATRSGAPVEIHEFPDAGAAAAFLGEALRALAMDEPRASVAVIARDPEHADLYFRALERSEVPRLSRVSAQDFSFKPGVEVTDVRQVKGLEFDYVLLVDVNRSLYPADDESRHLLHIAATRAAHQLWVLTSGDASPLLPASAIV